jgi:Trypsin
MRGPRLAACVRMPWRYRRRPPRRVTAILGASVALAVANVAAVSCTGQASAATVAVSLRTGSAFGGTRAVGALFLRSNGRLVRHFCTASVVHSTGGDLLLTAAHCMRGKRLGPAGSVVFAPGYHDGRMPLGLWVVTAKFVTSRWASDRDPNDDFAFLVVRKHHGPIERQAGAERLRTGTSLPARTEVIGYPDATELPIRCTAAARAFSIRALRMMKFVCGGYTNGTSGGPFLLHVSAKTGTGLIIGVIGGYQQGGNTPSVSYSARFGDAIAALYKKAAAATSSGQEAG